MRYTPCSSEQLKGVWRPAQRKVRMHLGLDPNALRGGSLSAAARPPTVPSALFFFGSSDRCRLISPFHRGSIAGASCAPPFGYWLQAETVISLASRVAPHLSELIAFDIRQKERQRRTNDESPTAARALDSHPTRLRLRRLCYQPFCTSGPALVAPEWQTNPAPSFSYSIALNKTSSPAYSVR